MYLSISACMYPSCLSVCLAGGLMATKLDCDIVVSEFEIQSRYYVHFRTNTPGKDMNPLMPQSYGLNSISTIFLQRWLWH